MSEQDWATFRKMHATASEAEINKRIDDDTCAVDAQGKIGCGEAPLVEIPWNSQEEVLRHHAPVRSSSKSTTLLLCFLGVAMAMLFKYSHRLRRLYALVFKLASTKDKTDPNCFDFGEFGRFD